MATLSRTDVEHVAHLARLGLTDDELARFEGQLNHILDQYAILAQLDTEAIPPTAQTIELENILREDVARPSLPPEEVVRNAPEHEGDFIVVPAILAGPDIVDGSNPERDPMAAAPRGASGTIAGAAEPAAGQ